MQQGVTLCSMMSLQRTLYFKTFQKYSYWKTNLIVQIKQTRQIYWPRKLIALAYSHGVSWRCEEEKRKRPSSKQHYYVQAIRWSVREWSGMWRCGSPPHLPEWWVEREGERGLSGPNRTKAERNVVVSNSLFFSLCSPLPAHPHALSTKKNLCRYHDTTLHQTKVREI